MVGGTNMLFGWNYMGHLMEQFLGDIKSLFIPGLSGNFLFILQVCALQVIEKGKQMALWNKEALRGQK